jgi:hypothetical protein
MGLDASIALQRSTSTTQGTTNVSIVALLPWARDVLILVELMNDKKERRFLFSLL